MSTYLYLSSLDSSPPLIHLALPAILPCFKRIYNQLSALAMFGGDHAPPRRGQVASSYSTEPLGALDLNVPFAEH